MQPVAFTLDNDFDAPIDKPIHGRVSHKRVSEDRRPFAEVSITGDDGRVSFIAAADNLIQIRLLFFAQRFESEIIEDEQRHRADQLQAALMGSVPFAGINPFKQRFSAPEHAIVALPASLVPEGLG